MSGQPTPKVERHYALTSTRRTARKPHSCMSCERRIPTGHVYIEHKAFPGHDSGMADAAGRPVRGAECADCALRYGREPLLDYGIGFPDDQPYNYWLGDGTPRPIDPLGGAA